MFLFSRHFTLCYTARGTAAQGRFFSIIFAALAEAPLFHQKARNLENGLAQKAQERGLLQLVEAAIGRINGGTSGECFYCGQDISVNRLTAVPWGR